MKTNEKEAELLFRVEAFQSSHGKRVERYTEIRNDEVAPKLMFYGYAALVSPHGGAPMNMRFPIEVETLEEALSRFEEFANKAVEEYQKQQAGGSIIVPPAGSFDRGGSIKRGG